MVNWYWTVCCFSQQMHKILQSYLLLHFTFVLNLFCEILEYNWASDMSVRSTNDNLSINEDKITIDKIRWDTLERCIRFILSLAERSVCCSCLNAVCLFRFHFFLIHPVYSLINNFSSNFLLQNKVHKIIHHHKGSFQLHIVTIESG